jgi:hypothetical protein
MVYSLYARARKGCKPRIRIEELGDAVMARYLIQDHRFLDSFLTLGAALARRKEDSNHRSLSRSGRSLLPYGDAAGGEEGSLESVAYLAGTESLCPSQIGSLTTSARQAAISACDDQHRLVLVLNGITTAGYSEPWLL